MDYPWWTYETNGGLEHENDYTNSYYDSFACEAPCEYICCNYCGYNHFSEQCPHVSTLDYVEDDFTRAQTHVYDDNFSLSQNHEQSLFWDPNCSLSPCASHYDSSPTFHVDEVDPINREKPTIEDMLQRILDNDNEISARQENNTLALQNLALQMSEIAYNLEALKQKGVFSNISNDASMEKEISSEESIMESEELLPVACDILGGECELEINEGENNTEDLVEVSILELDACCLEQESREEIPTIYDLDPSNDIVTLTDESQVDFIGFSNYLGGMDDNNEKVKLEPSISFVKLCIPRSFLIEEVHVSCLNEFSCLVKSFCPKRNEGKMVMIFDTYD